VVQFGKSPPNDPSLVYARRMLQTNIVLVPRAILDTLPASASDLRDRRLVTCDLAAVDSIEVPGTNGFTVRRQTNGTWITSETQPRVADPEAMHDWLMLLSSLEGTVESDVVTDFRTLYNLASPPRQYLLKASVTNAAGSVSNRVLAELDLGAVQGDKVFARRPDEASVYSLPLTNVMRLPKAPWQLRDRRVWSFTTNQLSRLIVVDRGRTNMLQRGPNHQWSIAAGSNLIINDIVQFSYVLDELMYRLGDLHAESWLAQGDESRAAFGFDTAERSVTFELKNSDKPRVLTLELTTSPGSRLYALAAVEGQTWIFEISEATFWWLMSRLFSPLFRDNPQ
jgi:hypothetical protein